MIGKILIQLTFSSFLSEHYQLSWYLYGGDVETSCRYNKGLQWINRPYKEREPTYTDDDYMVQD